MEINYDIDNNMRIGDTIVSKIDFHPKYTQIFFRKNQKYTIENIYKLGMTTTINPHTGESSYPRSYVYEYVINNHHFPEWELKDFFYTLKEIRAIKINNLKKYNHEKI